MTITKVTLGTQTITAVSLGTQVVTKVARGQTYWGCGTGTETATDTVAPVLSNEHINALGTNYAEWDWDTDEPANCYLKAYTTFPVTDTMTYIDMVTHEHYVYGGRSVVCTGLTRDTDYWFYLYSSDIYDNTGSSAGWKIKTAGDDGAGEAPIQE